MMTSEQAVIIIVIAFSLSAATVPSRSDANPGPIIDKVNKSDGARAVQPWCWRTMNFVPCSSHFG